MTTLARDENFVPIQNSETGEQSALGNNSTETPLGSGATFTGQWEQNDYGDVMVIVKTDNTGTLFFDFSPDGVNEDSTFPPNGFDVSSGISEFHTAVKGPRFFRVRLVNDSGAQTYCRLYTYYGNFRQGNLPISANIGADADATVVRSVNSELDLAFGKFGGLSEDGKYGYVENLGTSVVIGTPSSWVDLWYFGGQRTSPTSSFTPYIASSAAGDTDIPVTVNYFDANGARVSLTVNTDSSDGRTPVSLEVTATELTRGGTDSDTQPTGTITVATANNFTNGVPDNQGEVLIAIAPDDNQSQVCADRVPASTERRITNISLSINRLTGADGAALAVFQTRKTGGLWRTRRGIFVTNSSNYDRAQAGLILEAGEDFRIRIRDVSDSSTYVEGTVSYQDSQT